MSVKQLFYSIQSSGSAADTTEGTCIALYLPMPKLSRNKYHARYKIHTRNKYPMGFHTSNMTGKISSDEKNALKEQWCFQALLTSCDGVASAISGNKTTWRTSFHPSLTSYLVLPNPINFTLALPGFFLKHSCFHMVTKHLQVVFSNFWKLNWNKALKSPEEKNFCESPAAAPLLKLSLSEQTLRMNLVNC